MLIFTRKLDESIIINENIRITVIDICENRIKIGIEAPKHIPVHRTEVYDKIKSSKKIKNIERFTN
jgi:carbon storage regulator